MNRIRCSLAVIVALAAAIRPAADAAADQDPIVDFDLPAVVEARPDQADPRQVTIELRLSALLESPQTPRIDQWLIQCQPRGGEVLIVDYAPRTETASDLASTIQVKRTEESTRGVGLSVDGAYGHLVGSAAADRSKKSVDSVQFDRLAPRQAVTAAGTINRGRGVYFKLRSTPQQILDGEKRFKITLETPPGWRGGLIDVDVAAQSRPRKFDWDRDARTIGSAHFVVAAYRQGDRAAAARAEALSAAEASLRRIAAEYDASTPALPSLLRQLAIKLDLDPNPAAGWVQRLLHNQADPRLDDEICELPVPIRVAILDYVDLRDEFTAINGEAGGAIELK